MYDKHKREYTVVGVTAAFEAVVGKGVQKFFGGTVSETLSVIKNGEFWHFQIVGERENAAREFLKRVERGEVDFEKERERFYKLVDKYLKFINQPESKFSKKTILRLYQFYKDLMPTALAALDAVDIIDELPENKREKFLEWAKQIRTKEEPVYKNGEMFFVPRYMKWLKSKYFSKYTAEELQYLVYTEIEFWAKNAQKIPLPQELRKREKLFIVEQKPFGKIKFWSGKDAEKEAKRRKLFIEENYKNFKGFYGKTAFPGKIRGKVRVIRSRADMKKFRSDEIIVSPMTDPSYLPIMKRASAFVTDEGGLLCHAAIVARELKKPCVIGTKIATKAMKDGDLIEVDANKGIVRKI